MQSAKLNAYYREDTRDAYMGIVKKVMMAKSEEVAAVNDGQFVNYQNATPPPHTHIIQMIADLLHVSH